MIAGAKSLVSLKARYCNLGMHSTIAIAAALVGNSNLTRLDVCNNSIWWDEKKVDENEVEIEDKSEIYCREIIENKKTMSPYDAKGVYKTQAEIDRAIANGTFSIAKTMHVDKNGNIFFLVYDKAKLESQEEIHLRKLQLQKRQKIKLEQAQKLNRLLMQQASL